jgi:ABC-type uncharacterized transport system permease subunit
MQTGPKKKKKKTKILYSFILSPAHAICIVYIIVFELIIIIRKTVLQFVKLFLGSILYRLVFRFLLNSLHYPQHVMLKHPSLFTINIFIFRKQQ